MEPNVETYGLAGLVIYILVKDGLPALAKLTQRFMELLVPARAKARELAEQHEFELDERRIDMAEREVIALEHIGRMLVIIETKLEQQDKTLSLLTTSLVTANQSLAIMMDRVGRVNKPE